MGVSEMTRFGFGKEEFQRLAHLIAECVKGVEVKEEVAKFRADYTEMRYCFSDADTEAALQSLTGILGI